MKQHQLNQAVAKVTGESVRLIRAMGFGLLKLPTLIKRPRKAARLSASNYPMPMQQNPSQELRPAA